ncbi:hypothetical protein [Marichromatium sp. PS1]|uniref:hypothetical protein n=1 Tax=Marichromatium sp. PS1 TaxID=3138932 RepID=UPI0034E86D71
MPVAQRSPGGDGDRGGQPDIHAWRRRAAVMGTLRVAHPTGAIGGAVGHDIDESASWTACPTSAQGMKNRLGVPRALDADHQTSAQISGDVASGDDGAMGLPYNGDT